MNLKIKDYDKYKLVFGSKYGVKEFVIQRITAIIISLYTILLFSIAYFLNEFTFEKFIMIIGFDFKNIPIFQIVSIIFFISLSLHSWIGMRNIYMDYVKYSNAKLFLYTITISWILMNLIYFIKIIWSI